MRQENENIKQEERTCSRALENKHFPFETYTKKIDYTNKVKYEWKKLE